MVKPLAQPFVEVMAEALYGPEGYYTRGVNFLSDPPRDFTTAPELTPLFGATLADWVAQQWQRLGAPQGWVLCELGPGRGRLMAPLLRRLRADFPACWAALAEVRLVEVSPKLREVQHATLAEFTRCRWQETLSAGPAQIVLGNEVLDALPAQPYRLTEHDWERLEVAAGQLLWAPCPAPPLPASWTPAPGARVDVQPALPALLGQIRTHADAALLIDYGAVGLPPQGADTLQAVRLHQPCGLLEQLGDADLTVHVNFGEVHAQLGEAACRLVPLAEFLLQQGLAELALPLLPDPVVDGALQRLLHPARMGVLHQVLVYEKARA